MSILRYANDTCESKNFNSGEAIAFPPALIGPSWPPPLSAP
jgi:hypothetical protein